MLYSGGCHCGNISFEVDGEISSLLDCNCSHCAKKGFLLWFVPKDKLQVQTSAEHLSTYTFNKHVINHHFCDTCGCAPFGYGSDEKGNEMAAINARCLNDVDLSQFEIQHYDGRSA